MNAIANSVACDLRALALFRLLLAVAVAVNGVAYDDSLARLVLLPAITLFYGYRSCWSAIACWLIIAVPQFLDPAFVDESDALLMALFLLTALFAAAPQLERGMPLITVVAALVALLPACLWNWLGVLLARPGDTDIRIYYDRDCGFCRKTCYLFRTFFLLGGASVMPAQSDEDTFRIMRREVSWVVYDYDGNAFIRWHAVLLLLRRSPVLWPLGWLLTAFGMGYWGDPIYRAIGVSRWWLSKLTAVVLPYRRERAPAGRQVAILIGVWLIASLVVTALPPKTRPAGETASTVIHVLGLDQSRPIWRLAP